MIKAKWKIGTADIDGNYVQYEAGDIISGLDEKEENRLVKLGAAEFLSALDHEDVEEEVDHTTDDDNESPNDQQENQNSDADDNEPEPDLKIEFNADEYVQEGTKGRGGKKSGK